MLKMLTAAACLALSLGLGVTAAQAASAPPPPKADCSMFHKLTDGRWTSTITSKVGNPKEFVTLQPGLPIERTLVVAGLNVSETIDKLCGGN